MDTVTIAADMELAAMATRTWPPSTEATSTAATSTPASATARWAATSLEKYRLPVASTMERFVAGTTAAQPGCTLA